MISYLKSETTFNICPEEEMNHEEEVNHEAEVISCSSLALITDACFSPLRRRFFFFNKRREH
jgi:hypothetical protein